MELALGHLTPRQLKRQAIESGASQDEVDALDEVDDVKGAAIQLVLARKKEQLRNSLQSLSPRELKIRARHLGALHDDVDGLDDQDDVKSAAVELVLRISLMSAIAEGIPINEKPSLTARTDTTGGRQSQKATLRGRLTSRMEPEPEPEPRPGSEPEAELQSSEPEPHPHAEPPAADDSFCSCLDRQFVQMEIRWAMQYNKKIVVVYENDKRKAGFFDFGLARAKYAGTEWEPILDVHAEPYQRDEAYAEVMLQKLLHKCADAAAVEAADPPLNQPGSWDFFLSHAQTTGGDQTQNLRLRMTAAGQTVWYDNAMLDKSTRAMEEGVQHSRSFVLFLTADAGARQQNLFVPAASAMTEKEFERAFKVHSSIVLAATETQQKGVGGRFLKKRSTSFQAITDEAASEPSDSRERSAKFKAGGLVKRLSARALSCDLGNSPAAEPHSPWRGGDSRWNVVREEIASGRLQSFKSLGVHSWSGSPTDPQAHILQGYCLSRFGRELPADHVPVVIEFMQAQEPPVGNRDDPRFQLVFDILDGLEQAGQLSARESQTSDV